MGQYPSIKLTMHPSMFNLLMTVLEKNAEAVPQERERERAKELIEKRMRFSRVYSDENGDYVSVIMYDSEAAETVCSSLLPAPITTRSQKTIQKNSNEDKEVLRWQANMRLLRRYTVRA